MTDLKAIKRNMEKNDEGVYICKGRLQGFYSIYLLQDSVLIKKVTFAEHKRSFQGGSSHDNVS